MGPDVIKSIKEDIFRDHVTADELLNLSVMGLCIKCNDDTMDRTVMRSVQQYRSIVRAVTIEYKELRKQANAQHEANDPGQRLVPERVVPDREPGYATDRDWLC